MIAQKKFYNPHSVLADLWMSKKDILLFFSSMSHYRQIVPDCLNGWSSGEPQENKSSKAIKTSQTAVEMKE